LWYEARMQESRTPGTLPVSSPPRSPNP
jgi:hypothetical protein